MRPLIGVVDAVRSILPRASLFLLLLLLLRWCRPRRCQGRATDDGLTPSSSVSTVPQPRDNRTAPCAVTRNGIDAGDWFFSFQGWWATGGGGACPELLSGSSSGTDRNWRSISPPPPHPQPTLAPLASDDEIKKRETPEPKWRTRYAALTICPPSTSSTAEVNNPRGYISDGLPTIVLIAPPNSTNRPSPPAIRLPRPSATERTSAFTIKKKKKNKQ